MAQPEKKQRKRTAEYYKNLAKAGIKHNGHPADGRGHTTEFRATKHRGGSHSLEKQSRARKEKWIVIAQGGDGYNTWWHDDLEPVMRQIDAYVNAIDVYQLDLDWEEICDWVPYLKNQPWDISKDRPWNDYWENLEYTMKCILLDEDRGGGLPGQSGHFFTLKLRAPHKRSFLKTMRQLRESLGKYWEERELPKP